MLKSMRFDPELIEKIEEFKKEQGFKDFTKSTMFLIRSALEKRSYNRRASFIRCLNGLYSLSEQIRKPGILLNQLVTLYAQGKVPDAKDLNVTISELQKNIVEATALLAELKNTIIINE